jgi:hypothetical protein
MLHNSGKGGTRPPSQSSAPQKTAVGSGSRPSKSTHCIDSSAPDKPRHLDSRHVPGALGVK